MLSVFKFRVVPFINVFLWLQAASKHSDGFISDCLPRDWQVGQEKEVTGVKTGSLSFFTVVF